jgi:hypothetical protein
MPSLTVRWFFPGLVVRVAKAFSDFDGQAIVAGEIFHIVDETFFPYEDGVSLIAEKTIRLSGNVDDNAVVIYNDSNAFFEPVRCLDSARACLKLIDSYWELPQVHDAEHAREVRADIDIASAWLQNHQPGAVPPNCTTLALVAQMFPMQPALRVLIPLLFGLLPG